MTRVLVIEDNPDLAYGLRNNLEIEGYEVDVVGDGAKGLARARDADVELVILDLMLPGMDGFRVLRALRDEGRRVPVLILTARGEESDKVRGLRLGADDYVTKPFGVLELLARVEALLRRATRDPAAPEPDVERFGEVEVVSASRTVIRAGQPVALTPKEYELLVALLRRRGAVASRVELLTEVWGYNSAVMSRTVDTHIAELRRKLEEDLAAPQHILTVRKAKYRLQTSKDPSRTPRSSRSSPCSPLPVRRAAAASCSGRCTTATRVTGTGRSRSCSRTRPPIPTAPPSIRCGGNTRRSPAGCVSISSRAIPVTARCSRTTPSTRSRTTRCARPRRSCTR